MNFTEQKLSELFESWSKEAVKTIYILAASGSDRKYFRIKGNSKSALGAFNANQKENEAFCSFTESFLKSGINVPKIYKTDLKNNIYLIQDLGNQTLFEIINSSNANPEILRPLYQKAIDNLIKIQIEGNKKIDYNLCYPRNKFDKNSMMWDLNYFKYYFLKLGQIPFDEQELENDFETFTNYLEKIPSDYFMFRDFQSRNIMIENNELFFIDYQGGRKGALHYDLASLLYDGKAGLSEQFREEMLDYYISQIQNHIDNINPLKFKKEYNAFVLIRIMQALGSYGYRGFFQHKAHFLLSIPYAQKNLRNLLGKIELEVKIPTIISLVGLLADNKRLGLYGEKHEKLKITVNSFSFKNGYPEDYSGNGGGFVFDCRGLDNPGRYVQYNNLTGKDQEVIDFFKQHDEIDIFTENAIKMIEATIKNYIKRNFSDLSISFGCTGGRHRSVYCAQTCGARLAALFPEIDIQIRHRELIQQL